MRCARWIAAVAALVACAAAPGAAQRPTGDASLFADYLPNRTDTAELRARVFAEQVFDPTPRVLITLSGFAEGLLARRPKAPAFEAGSAADGILRVQEATFDYTGDRFGLLVGYGRVVWGRLDELQPTDVVNPTDASRFFFEGRSEARLPVALARGRLFVSESTTIEGVYVPAFRRGRFDQLEEASSPFNIESDALRDIVVCLALTCPPLPTQIEEQAPSFSVGNAQGGVRISATTGRVDWSVSAWRGFEAFGLYDAAASQAGGAAVAKRFPRFTMVGADFETVRGQWGMRGEAAAFVEDSFQDPLLRITPGRSLDAGAAVDRRAGDYRVSGSVLLHHESYDAPIAASGGPQDRRTDVSLMVSADRTFARERHRARLFTVVNPGEGSGFVRGIASTDLRDDLLLEASAGWFAGAGRDLVGRFADSDFVYVRLKHYF